MNTYQTGELAKKILFLAVGVGAIATVVVLPGMGILFKHFNASDARERYRIKEALKRMEAKSEIRRRINKGREEYVVTNKGKQKLAVLLVKELVIKKPTKWDGRWRVLIYDIPNKKNLEHRELSRVIAQIGMKPAQKSVFVSPYPCREQIDTIVTFYRLSKYVSYFEADYFEGNNDLLADFGLVR